MKYSIKIKKLNFNVSKSFVNAIRKHHLEVFTTAIEPGTNYQSKSMMYVLKDSCLSFFLVIPTTSSKYFSIEIQERSRTKIESTKVRVNKFLYDFLASCPRQQQKQAIEKMLLITQHYHYGWKTNFPTTSI